MNEVVLFGVRTPLVVEYEETCRRAGITIPFAVNVAGAPRLSTPITVVELGDLQSQHREAACVVCAFSPARRRELADLARRAGFRFADPLIDPASTLAGSARVGAGSYVNAGCVVGALVILGDHVLFNRSSSAGHHSVMADFVSVGPGVTIAGNVRVGEGSILGAGCVVLPGIRIGAGAIIAAGSVVRKNVPDGVFVAGNPAIEREFDMTRSSLNTMDAE